MPRNSKPTTEMIRLPADVVRALRRRVSQARTVDGAMGQWEGPNAHRRRSWAAWCWRGERYQRSWEAFNNGMPQGTIVTKLRVNPTDGTIYAATFGRGAFALDTVFLF